MRIGVDILGSDSSPTFLFQAVLQAAEKFPHICFVVFCTKECAQELFLQNSKVFPLRHTYPRRVSFSPNSIEIEVVKEAIEMGDDPLVSIRKKRHSSLMCGIRSLKKCHIDAFVTTGNTGALIAAVTISLPLLPDIKRPALLAHLPTEKGYVTVVDVGGNVSCKAEHLVQFAKLGEAYQKSFVAVTSPRIGLLNIGIESRKGTLEIRKCYQLLQELHDQRKIHFIGNIEGKNIFRGDVDVVVTDGFTGNVFLKTSEGVSLFMCHKLRGALKDLPENQKEKILQEFMSQFDSEEYPGAVVCGVDRVVVKCHGKSSTKAFLQGLICAIKLVQNQFLQQIKEQF